MILRVDSFHPPSLIDDIPFGQFQRLDAPTISFRRAPTLNDKLVKSHLLTIR